MEPKRIMVDGVEYAPVIPRDPLTPLPMHDTGHPYPVGEAVFVRTVTMHYTGKLVRVTEQELVLVECAWIADSGRWSTALRTGVLNEVEPYPDGEVVVPRVGSEVCRWSHTLPRDVK